MILNPTRIIVPHICVTSIHESQISPVSLYEEPFLSYRPFWEKCIEWPQNDLEHYELKCTQYVLVLSLIPKFHSVLLYGQPFLRYRVFWDKCTEWTQMILNPTRSNAPHICISTIPGSQISLYDQPFLRYKPVWDTCTEWLQIDLEPYKVKTPYTCITSVPDYQISLRFAVQPAIFKIQANLRQVYWMTPKWP